MIDMVMVNPSANMKKIAMELDERKIKTIFVKTSDIPYFTPDRVYYFFNGYNVYFSSEIQGSMEKDEGIFLFKPGFISKIRLGSIEKKLASINPDFEEGNFNDYIMFRRGALEYDSRHGETLLEYKDISAVCSEYNGSIVLTSCAIGHSSVKMVVWKTDYDWEETFGKDYFVFYTPSGRVEAFFYEGMLHTIGEDTNHAAMITALNKSLKKFSFEKVSEKAVVVNKYPWILENSHNKYFLINDYSFSQSSISMPAGWYDKLASYISLNGSFAKLLQKKG